MALRYSKHLRYLVPTILYLGMSKEWWARSSGNMSHELSLDENGLHTSFQEFPEIFRRSKIADAKTGQHYYSLQARYAKRSGNRIDELEKVEEVPPLTTEEVRLILDFVLKMADSENSGRRAGITNAISVTAAVVAAIAAITAATLRPSCPPAVQASPTGTESGKR